MQREVLPRPVGIAENRLAVIIWMGRLCVLKLTPLRAALLQRGKRREESEGTKEETREGVQGLKWRPEGA